MNYYFHTDLESTTLDALTGHIRSIGWVVTDGNLQEVSCGHVEQAVPDVMWDAATWQWATETYSAEYLKQFKGWHIEGPVQEAWWEILKRLLGPLFVAVKELEDAGHKCWLICNHPDFDATMLRAACRITSRVFPFKHDRVLDMASLMMAYNAGVGHGEQKPALEPTALLDELGFKKEAVQHTALEDARRQVEILKAVSLRLPL